MNANVIPPVTICPPGKRAGGVVRAPLPSVIPLNTEPTPTAPKRSASIPSAKGDRLPIQARLEDAERAAAVAVALAQPERRGIADAAEASQAGSKAARLHEALGRFCARQWPRDEEWSDSMYRAGSAYDEIIRDSLIAMGLPYIGQAGGRDGGEELSVEQAAARKEVALARRKRADEILVRVHARGARVMESLCYVKRDPSPYDDGVLRNGLYALADWLRIIDRGINEGRA